MLGRHSTCGRRRSARTTGNRRVVAGCPVVDLQAEQEIAVKGCASDSTCAALGSIVRPHGASPPDPSRHVVSTLQDRDGPIVPSGLDRADTPGEARAPRRSFARDITVNAASDSRAGGPVTKAAGGGVGPGFARQRQRQADEDPAYRHADNPGKPGACPASSP